MKICIYSDPHWSTYSSILRQRGIKYSKRLEGLINSINWVESLAKNNYCNEIYCLGDFFDRNNLTAEEITALNDICWSDLPHLFLVGNHEITTSNLEMNSLNVLRKIGNVIDKPSIKYINGCNLVFLPYLDEDTRQPLKEILDGLWLQQPKTIIFSHNDIRGIQYGAYTSEFGFSLDEIENNCNMFINGHLHNCNFVNKRDDIPVLNIGNLTGLNFTENAFECKHFACILDTDTLDLQFYENPYAFYFYSINTISNEFQLDTLDILPNNSLVSVKVVENLLPKVKDKLNRNYNVIAHREVIIPDNNVTTGEHITLTKVNHIDKFKEFCLSQLGNLELVKKELNEICK